MTVRIAMWSGPRNISTALMRSWESRLDTEVIDEPLYAHYLDATGLEHPARAEILRSQDTDYQRVTAMLAGPAPMGRSIWYQKHMSHHLLDDADLSWTKHTVNCFLIREPREMLTSYLKVLRHPTPRDLGLPQQVRLFDHVRRETGSVPPVIHGRDVLENPRGMLTAICSRVGVSFDEAMLRWEPGPRDSDGVWAPHWYDSVRASAGFGPYRRKDDDIPDDLREVHEECLGLYAQLRQYAISPSEGTVR